MKGTAYPPPEGNLSGLCRKIYAGENMRRGIREKLFMLRDRKYGDFSAGLTPNIPRELFIGVRAAAIKALAREIHQNNELEDAFLQDLPHQYVEEYLLHIHLLNGEKDFECCIDKINRILPYIDNWMTCDAIRPAVFKGHLKEAEKYIKAWMDSEEVYTSRFGIEMLMCYYLDDAFDRKYLEWVSNVRRDHYYHRMMIAWYFATALAKQYEACLPYIRGKKLEKWTHNKAIQKARESFKVSDERKKELHRFRWS